jgi:lipoate-protein ligase A
MALLERANDADAGPTVTWWEVARDTLVLGRGSRVPVDDAACQAAGVDVVRRASGGGPVVWGPDLAAFDIVVPRGHPLHGADIAESYRWIGEAVARALRRLGIAARSLPPGEAHAANEPSVAELACFAGLGPWEVVVDGRKLVGLSQVRRRSGALLQVGILVHHDAARLTGLLDLDPPTRAMLTDALRSRTVSTADHGVSDLAALRAAVTTALDEAL